MALMEKEKGSARFSVSLTDIRLLLLMTIFIMAVFVYSFDVNSILGVKSALTEPMTIPTDVASSDIVEIPGSSDERERESKSAQAQAQPPEEKNIKNIEIEILKQGGGLQALRGKEISFHYKSELLDGTTLDNTHYRRPIQIKLGDNAIIPGLDIGIEGMRVGGKRRITIPPEFAWGEAGFGAVPPGAVVVFEVELMSVFE